MRAHLKTVAHVWVPGDTDSEFDALFTNDGLAGKERGTMADVLTASDGPGADVNYVAADTELKAGALGFWGGMIQAVTHIAPGLNVLLGLTFIVSFAGVTAPIAYILGGVICLGVAVTLTQLAKQFTGAGGYFLYVSSTIGPRTGWLTTWLYFLYDPIAVSSVCAFTGLLVQQTLQQQYGVDISWYFWFFAFLIIITGFTLFGISLSARAMLVLGGFEVLVFLVLAISGLASPGRRRLQLRLVQPRQPPERQRSLSRAWCSRFSPCRGLRRWRRSLRRRRTRNETSRS